MKNEKEIRKLLGNDYHLSIEMKNGEIMQWALFRNYTDSGIYFSEDNKAIMRSGLNTEEELYDFAKKHHRMDYNKFGNKVVKFSIMLVFVIAIINVFLGGVFSQFVLTSDLWLLIWLYTNHKIYEHNWKVDMLELAESFERRKKDLQEKLEKELKEIEEENNELR